jgi:hypothetical protein
VYTDDDGVAAAVMVVMNEVSVYLLIDRSPSSSVVVAAPQHYDLHLHLHLHMYYSDYYLHS